MTARLASMPMYDFPEVRRTTTALWEIIVRYCRREGLTDIPSTLVHDRPVRQLWIDEKMVSVSAAAMTYSIATEISSVYLLHRVIRHQVVAEATTPVSSS